MTLRDFRDVVVVHNSRYVSDVDYAKFSAKLSKSIPKQPRHKIGKYDVRGGDCDDGDGALIRVDGFAMFFADGFATITEALITARIDEFTRIQSELVDQLKREQYIATHHARCVAGQKLIEQFIADEKKKQETMKVAQPTTQVAQPTTQETGGNEKVTEEMIMRLLDEVLPKILPEIIGKELRTLHKDLSEKIQTTVISELPRVTMKLLEPYMTQ